MLGGARAPRRPFHTAAPAGFKGLQIPGLGILRIPSGFCISCCLVIVILFQSTVFSRRGGCDDKLEAAASALTQKEEQVSALLQDLERTTSMLQHEKRQREQQAVPPQHADAAAFRQAGALEEEAGDAWAAAGQESKPSAQRVPGRDAAGAEPPAQRGAAAVALAQAPELEPAPTNPRDARALLVICYNRPDYLRRTLTSVLDRLPTYNRPHVYVSQDGDVADVTAVVNEFKAAFAQRAPDVPFVHLRHAQDPSNAARQWGGYYALAQHFGAALGRVFGDPDKGHPRVIILEDDLEIAPDFFDYFSAVEPILDGDRSLLAASAWADIGQPQFVADPARVYRSDFFPGLGWMLTKHAWEELGPKWPDSFWDDWLREPPQRKGRAFLRPEISRTYTFGQQGVSQAQFFAQFLGNIKLNDAPVDWAAVDLRYLLKGPYDAWLRKAVSAAREVPFGGIVSAKCDPPAAAALRAPKSADGDDEAVTREPEGVKATYQGFEGPGSYTAMARAFGFIDDVKANVPRAAYQGVSIIRHNGCRKFLVDASKAQDLQAG